MVQDDSSLWHQLRAAFLADSQRLCVPSTAGAMPAAHVHTVPSELSGALEFLGELALIPSTAAEVRATTSAARLAP